MMEEIWKDIKGFEGRYQVSNLGRVRSLDMTWTVQRRGREYTFTRKGRIRKFGKTIWGYYSVNIYVDGKTKRFPVHRFVAKTFLPNPYNYPEVNHKDENKLNNTVWINEDGSIDYEKTNLEWCTTQYNLSYGTRNERFQKKSNEPRMRAVNQYDLDGNLINTFKSIAEAGRAVGISTRNIWSICNKKGNSASGFVFRYSDDASPWIELDADKCRSNEERMQAIAVYDLNGNYIRSFESVSKASRETGINKRWIDNICKQRKGCKSAHGYIFRYMK